MDDKEVELTTPQAIRELEAFDPPVPITDEVIRVYKRGHMVGATVALRLSLREVMKRDLSR